MDSIAPKKTAVRKSKGKRHSAAFDRRINELDLQGFSGAEIGAQLGMTRQGVNFRLKNLRLIKRSIA